MLPFYTPWKHQKTYCFIMISRGNRSCLIHLNSLNNRNEIRWRSLKNVNINFRTSFSRIFSEVTIKNHEFEFRRDSNTGFFLWNLQQNTFGGNFYKYFREKLHLRFLTGPLYWNVWNQQNTGSIFYNENCHKWFTNVLHPSLIVKEEEKNLSIEGITKVL